jgi:glycosyltransferase involved in cell wall biosynthesis
MTNPSASVLIVMGARPERARHCIERVLAQQGAPDVEIVVVDISPDGNRTALPEHPCLRVLHRPDLRGVGEARLAVLEASRGDIVLYIEDHAWPADGWLKAVLDAFEAHPKVALVNYAIRNADPRGYISRCYHLVDYGPWAHPARTGPIRYPCHHNLAYRRDLLLRHVAGRPGMLEAEFLVHRALLAEGHELWLSGDAVIFHQTWSRVADGFLANGSMKRCIAAIRAERGSWGFPRRAAMAAAMVLSPPLHAWRLARTLPGRPALWGDVALGLPIFLAAFVHSSQAEARGYLFGVGGAKESFAFVECDLERSR